MRRVIVAAVPLVLLAALAALRVSDLATSRQDLLLAAERRAANLAAITAAYLDESFASADAVLRQLALHSRRVGGPAAAASEWMPTLMTARAGVSVGALTITDATGIVRHSTRPEIVGQSRSDETAFRDALRAGPDALIVGTPFPTVDSTPAAPRYIIPITRALTDGDRIVGTATASFLPAVAEPFLQSVDVGPGGSLQVRHPNGVVLFSERGQARPDAADATGAAAITASHTMTDPPLIVSVSLDQGDVLTPWRREATRSAVLFGIVAALLVAVIVVLLREMSARSVALRREQRARHDAESASAVKDQFLMTLSHELRTPLTAVRGWARMLALDTVRPEDQRRAVEAIDRNAQAQERLIEDLLDMSRVMSGKLPLHMQPVPIAEVVQRALDTVRPTAEAKGVRLETAIDPDAGTVSADPERLQQVIWNLLSNAIKFTPAGGRVLVAAKRHDGQVQLEVSDTGIGISREFLPHVFERFRQEDASTTREHGGLGLGLAIARSLVDMHGGTLTARSDGSGRGATFTVRLPLFSRESHPVLTTR